MNTELAGVCRAKWTDKKTPTDDCEHTQITTLAGKAGLAKKKKTKKNKGGHRAGPRVFVHPHLRFEVSSFESKGDCVPWRVFFFPVFFCGLKTKKNQKYKKEAVERVERSSGRAGQRSTGSSGSSGSAGPDLHVSVSLQQTSASKIKGFGTSSTNMFAGEPAALSAAVFLTTFCCQGGSP